MTCDMRENKDNCTIQMSPRGRKKIFLGASFDAHRYVPIVDPILEHDMTKNFAPC